MKINHVSRWNRLLPLCALLLATFPVLAGNVAYTYDALDRLTRAEYSDGTVVEYRYDAAGNRIGHVVQTATINLPGDVNGDGKVDAVDLVAVINHFLGLQNWWPRADCTGDGKVDALDMVFVVKRVLGK